MLSFRRMRRGAGGIAYLEALAALAVVGLALLAATGFTMRRHEIIERVDVHVIADQALASEMDMALADQPSSLALGEHPWRSAAGKVKALPGARGIVRVTQAEPGLRLVRIELRWGKNGVMARERLVAAP